MRSIAVVTVLCLAAPFAHGADDAKTLFERGTALFALHKFSGAAEAFEKAFELKPDPAILYNAAQAHRLAGDKARALELYESLVRVYGHKLPNLAEINMHIRELRHAIEAERRATSAPPVTPWPKSGDTAAPPAAPEAPPPRAETASPAPPLVVAAAPEKKPARPKWLWGVIGGVAAAVVVAGVTVGVVLGTRSTVAPDPTLGRVPGN